MVRKVKKYNHPYYVFEYTVYNRLSAAVVTINYMTAKQATPQIKHFPEKASQI